MIFLGEACSRFGGLFGFGLSKKVSPLFYQSGPTEGHAAHEMDQRECGGIGHFVEAAVKPIGVAGGVGHAAEQRVGSEEQRGEFCAEFAAVGLDERHAVGEDAERGGVGARQRLVGMEMPQGLEEPRHEGVDLVVGAARVSGEAQDAARTSKTAVAKLMEACTTILPVLPRLRGR